MLSRIDRKNTKRIQLILKRLFDIFFSVIGLIVLAPIFLIIAILIKLDSPGPVFFRQERVGKDGKIFKIWKFRTMYINNNFTTEQIRNFEIYGKDPRITKIGKVLRKLGLDELPQLINIFLGQMSFVGPRPFYPPRYQLNPDFKERLVIKPGLTCLAVINGGAKLNEEETLFWDKKYIESASFLLDLKIIFKTIFLYLSKLWKKDLKNGKNPN